MIDELQEWLDKAEWDWRSAGDILKLPQINAGLAGFLCQQCAEKLLKAAIISRGETPPKIHDLVSLSRRLTRLEKSWDWDEPELARLTKAAVDYRYPGMRVDETFATEAYELVDRLRNALLPLIPSKKSSTGGESNASK
jgi:HEPN domain-containing protein